MSAAPRVTIAGGGALGLATALALADAGAQVTVSDPGPAQASQVAAGMLAPAFEALLDETARPHLDLLLAARDQWPALSQRARVALDRSGAIAVGAADWLQTLAADGAALGLYPTEIAGVTACALAPGLRPDVAGALLTREDWRIDALEALTNLRAAAAEAGVAFRRDAVDGRGEADVLILATGAANDPRLAPELSVVTPIKGHILRFATPAFGVVVRGQGVYAAPGRSGLCVGATMEPGVADPRVEPSRAEPLKAAGAALFPGAADADCQVAAGVRGATPDGLPMVGWSREPGVLVASGARRNGWLLAPLVARIAAALVMDRDPGRLARRLDPRRFPS